MVDAEEDLEVAADMKVAILAGGKGTRLGALARGLPKPMVMVAGRPFLEYVVESFTACGFTEFVFLVGHHADVIESHFRGGRGEVRFEYSRERQPLGTGGAVRNAEHLLGERFILTYGDVLRRFDYDRFVNEHHGNCLAAYPRITAGNTIIENGLVILFDKSAVDLPYVDAGFSLAGRETIELLPPFGACSFEQIVYGTLAIERRLAGEIVDQAFFDIGTPEELARTRAELEGERR
ncbi:MAG TPA: sugar phosphate nucleotidyltransferase [Thermoanaerobaculia bacterium]|nr:sugar phosphate nucleotidyltransferase [Thermoanaerobaculia bacterium]